MARDPGVRLTTTLAPCPACGQSATPTRDGLRLAVLCQVYWATGVCPACRVRSRIPAYTICEACLAICQTCLCFPAELIRARQESAESSMIPRAISEVTDDNDIPF